MNNIPERAFLQNYGTHGGLTTANSVSDQDQVNAFRGRSDELPVTKTGSLGGRSGKDITITTPSIRSEVEQDG